jgi:hypothetical protein
MKTYKLLAGLLAVAICSPALAIDDFSRGAAIGVAGAWLFNKFNNMPQQQQYPQQRGVYQQGGGVYQQGGIYPPVATVPPMQPQGNYVYTCYVQVQDPYTGMVQLQQQVCMGR